MQGAVSCWLSNAHCWHKSACSAGAVPHLVGEEEGEGLPSLLQSQISKSGLKDLNDGSFWVWRDMDIREHPAGAEARG